MSPRRAGSCTSFEVEVILRKRDATHGTNRHLRLPFGHAGQSGMGLLGSPRPRDMAMDAAAHDRTASRAAQPPLRFC